MTTEGLKAPPADGSWGVDKALCLFPINSEHIQLDDTFWTFSERWDKKQQKHVESYKGSRFVGNAKVDVYFRPDWNECTVAFNPSLVFQKKSSYLLPPSRLSAAVSIVLDGIQPYMYGAFDDFDPQTGELGRAANWEQHIRFSRLDFARNFHILEPKNIPSIKKAIENSTPNRSKYKSTYGSKDGGWTVYNGTKGSGVDLIYDKNIELQRHKNAESAPEHTWRFETQLKGGRLKAPFNVKTLDKISNESVWNVLEHRWQTCGWGVPVSEPNTIFSATEHLSQSIQSKLIGDLYLFEHGLTTRMDARQKAEVVKRARSCGLVAGMPIELSGTPIAFLDINTGGLVDL